MSTKNLHEKACWGNLCNSHPSAGLALYTNSGLWKVGHAIWFLSHKERRVEYLFLVLTKEQRTQEAEQMVW